MTNKINFFGEVWEEITYKEWYKSPDDFAKISVKINDVWRHKYFRKVKPKLELPKTFGDYEVRIDVFGQVIIDFDSAFKGFALNSGSYFDCKKAIAYAEKFYEQEKGEKKNEKF